MSQQFRKAENVNTNMKKRIIIVNNFLGGLAWGLGSVIGATVIVAILIGLLRSVNFIPGLGDLTSQIMENVNNSKDR